MCNGQPGRAALAEIDALRYAEEHAVRYEAVGSLHKDGEFKPFTSSKAMGQSAPRPLEVLLDEH